MSVDATAKTFPFRKIGIAVAAVLGIYLGSYAILSATGGWGVSESGEVRMIHPLVQNPFEGRFPYAPLPNSRTLPTR
jgi:hypothetical protein